MEEKRRQIIMSSLYGITSLSGWQSELALALEVKQRIILHGNIFDWFMYEDRPLSLPDWLSHQLEHRGYEIVVLYDIINGYTPVRGQELASSLTKSTILDKKEPSPEGVHLGAPTSVPVASRAPTRGDRSIDVDLYEARTLLRNNQHPTALIMLHTDKLVAHGRLHMEVDRRHAVLLRQLTDQAAVKIPIPVKESNEEVPIDQRRTLNNIALLLFDQEGLIPLDIYVQDTSTKIICIPPPSHEIRENFFIREQNRFFGVSSSVVKTPSETLKDTTGYSEVPYHPEKFSQITEGLHLRELYQLAELSYTEGYPPDKFEDLVRYYKFGKKENYWERVTKETLQGAECYFTEEGEKIRGQKEAIKSVVKMLYRAKAGVSGFAKGNITKPRGTLFFVGPTGVGKTMLAKKLTTLLFGQEEACIVFDMSEYMEPHAHARLVGAPPGYIGYEEGGQLTSRVRQQPFCVLLFDEIEKAHPRVLDIFLQILEEGRLTDGKGERVYFSESVIIFTSNIGTRDANVSNFSTRTELEEYFCKAVQQYFTQELNRPELLNRLGENIVVFNYIVDSNLQKQIVKDKFEFIIARFKKEYPAYKFTYNDPVVDFILKRAQFGEYGGRGLGNLIEANIVTELARCVINKPGGSYKITLNKEGNIITKE